MLFPLINSGGYFITEELDFPDTRVDMNLNNERMGNFLHFSHNIQNLLNDLNTLDENTLKAHK